MILEPKEYVEQIRSVTDALYEKNWKIYSLKNYWVNDSFPYNGVNAKFKNSRNYRIESQFHTQESFDVKMSEEDHKPVSYTHLAGRFCDRCDDNDWIFDRILPEWCIAGKYLRFRNTLPGTFVSWI